MCQASSTLALCLMAVAAADVMCSHGPGGTCSSVDAADRGHGLLQHARHSQKMDEFMSEELVDEHAVNVEMNTNIVHNIPVYGYHLALHAHQPRISINSTGVECEPKHTDYSTGGRNWGEVVYLDRHD